MNTDVLDKPIVLSLNRAWQVIGHRTVKQALIALNGGAAGLPPALGVQAETCPAGTMATLAEGHENIVRCIPL